MYKQKYVLVFYLFLICIFSELSGQVSVVPSSGCLPAGITNAIFSYTGSGTPSNIVWNYGDGSPTSTLLSTQHSYPALGTYVISFSAIVGGSPVTYTTSVTVHPSPTGNFSSSLPSSHCGPMSVNFTGSSSSSNVVFTWAFGDLAGGSGSPVSHSYGPGTYVPNVTIQNSLTGCFITVPGNPINVSNLPTINISASAGTSTCAATFVTALDASGSTSGSPSGGGLTYSWNLGQFGGSSQANTGNVLYSPVGVYIVTVTATDNNSCSNVKTVQISLVSPTVTAVVPPSVCVMAQTPYSPPEFVASVMSNELFTTWDMGDGSPLKTFPPPPTTLSSSTVAYSGTIHAYTSPGPKVVTIKVQNGACITTITKNIFVEKITPTFVATAPSYTCSPTFTLGFTNQTTINSGSSLSYNWKVAHWNKQLQDAYVINNNASPVFTVSQGSFNPYTNYNHVPYFIATDMTVTSAPVGCTVSFGAQTDTILRATAMFETNKSEGCVPLVVTFSNTGITTITVTPNPAIPTYTTNTPSAIQSYTWNFGASPTSTAAGTGSIIPNIVFSYTAPGVYYPTLTIETAGGCSHTSYVHTITVVDPPIISYTLPPSPVCAGQTFSIQLASTLTAQHWHVEGDGGYFSSCVNNSMPTWTLNNPQLSPQTFTISAYVNSCKTSVVTTPVTVKGPSAKLRFQTNCKGDRMAVKFFYDLLDVVTATLNFGDGSPTGTVLLSGVTNSVGTEIYTYAASGNYTVTLIAVNGPNGCLPDTARVLVTVRNLTADFVFVDDVVCKNIGIKTDAMTSIDVFTVQGIGYTWYVENMPPVQTDNYTVALSNTNTAVGMHAVTLVVKDTNNCSESITKSYRVSAPAPEFTFNTNPICLSNMPVTFQNLTPQSPDPVFKYGYYTGDSVLYVLPPPYHTVLSTTNNANFSPSFSFPHIGGLQTRTFTVTLFATNSEGCTEHIRHTLTVNDPIIDIKRSDYKGCAPAAISFYFNAASTHTNYNINWGDGSPVINITSYNTNSTYTNTHIYLNPGTYTPSFILTDFGGCSKPQTFSLSPMIIQSNPVSTFTFYNAIDNLPGPGPFCAPLSPSVVSIRNSPYPLNYTWDLFGTGGVLTLDSTAFTNYPSGPATYTVSLKVATIPAGCSSYSQNIVQVFAPLIGFVFDPDSLKTVYCLGEPITVSVTTFPGVQYYKWDFSDGVVTPSVYPVPGIPATLRTTYGNLFYPESTNGNLTIELVGYAGGGNKICKDVQRKTVKIIKAKPDFNRNNELLPLDSIHCLGKPEVFKNLSTTNVTSSLNYTWSLGDGTVNNDTDVSYTYASPGTYSVKLNVLEPIHGCSATITKKMVIFPLPTASMSLIPFSCPKTPFVLNGSGKPGVSGVLSGTVLPGPLTLTFNTANTFSMTTTASVSTTYSLKVVDENGCENSAATASIYIQEAAPEIHWDTTIVIGEPTPLNAYAGPGFSYTWTPLVDYLNCDTCLLFNPVSTTTSSITYSVSVEDGHQCSVVQNTYKIYVEIKVSLDVPTAFTPNGDGVNDMIYPGGWGLKKLNYFKVFNRWGQLVFESNDLNIGWDGVFKGVPQNIETYVYQVSAETYLDSQPTLTQTGTFKLLR